MFCVWKRVLSTVRRKLLKKLCSHGWSLIHTNTNTKYPPLSRRRHSDPILSYPPHPRRSVRIASPGRGVHTGRLADAHRLVRPRSHEPCVRVCGGGGFGALLPVYKPGPLCPSPRRCRRSSRRCAWCGRNLGRAQPPGSPSPPGRLWAVRRSPRSAHCPTSYLAGRCPPPHGMEPPIPWDPLGTPLPSGPHGVPTGRSVRADDGPIWSQTGGRENRLYRTGNGIVESWDLLLTGRL